LCEESSINSRGQNMPRGPRRAELRRKAREAARARERQVAAPSQDEAEESDATEEEATRERTTRVGRPRGGMKGCSENRGRETAKRDRKRRTPKGGRRLAHHTPLLKIPVWWRRAVLPSLPWVESVFFLSPLEYWPLLSTHTTGGRATRRPFRVSRVVHSRESCS